MRLKHHIVGLIICSVLVAEFQYFAVIWSFADFHPGYNPDVSEEFHRRARIGSAMSRPFIGPALWLAPIAGGYSTSLVVSQWFVLPVGYGAALYLTFALLRQHVFSNVNPNN